MVRRLFIPLGVFFLFSISLKAQREINLFGGYSYEHLGSSPVRNLNGVEIAGQYNLRNWLGVVADMDGQYGLPSRADSRTLHFMVGPQISVPAHISPFLHARAGIGHVSLNGRTNISVSAAIGAGIDVRILPLISWRIIQVDDVITRFFGRIENSARISTGFVFRF